MSSYGGGLARMNLGQAYKYRSENAASASSVEL